MTSQTEKPDTKTLLIAHKYGAVMFEEPLWEKVEAMKINPELLHKWKNYIAAKKELEAIISSIAVELDIDMEATTK